MFKKGSFLVGLGIGIVLALGLHLHFILAWKTVYSHYPLPGYEVAFERGYIEPYFSESPRSLLITRIVLFLGTFFSLALIRYKRGVLTLSIWIGVMTAFFGIAMTISTYRESNLFFLHPFILTFLTAPPIALGGGLGWLVEKAFNKLFRPGEKQQGLSVKSPSVGSGEDSLEQPQPEKPRQNSAMASFVLGIISMVFSVVVVGAVTGVLGIFLGLKQLFRKGEGKGLAWWGIFLSVGGIILSIGMTAFYFQQIRTPREKLSNFQGMVDQWEGKTAPNFSVATLDGGKFTLDLMKGKRVVLDFWATWCGPCVKEIPHLMKLNEETSREELVIVGISEENVGTLKEFVEKRGLKYPVAQGKNLPPPFSEAMALPTTFVIDRNGIIQKVFIGYQDYETLRTEALGKKNPS